VQSNRVVDLDEVLDGQLEPWTEPAVLWVGVRDYGVQSIIAAVELHDDKDPAIAFGHSGAGGPNEEAGERRCQGKKWRGSQQSAASEHGIFSVVSQATCPSGAASRRATT
jgi:hypothetical protein